MKDEELEKIRQKKMKEIMNKFSESNIRDEDRVSESTLGKPLEVTDVTFSEIIHRYPVVVIDCWAPWCAPCRMIAPTIEEMAEEYASKILFAKLNVDENQRIAFKFDVMSIPTLLVFKDGNLVDRIVGAMPRNMLEPKITRYLQ